MEALRILTIHDADGYKLNVASRRLKHPQAFQGLVEQMAKTMHIRQGWGLAAAQVGHPLSLFVMELPALHATALRPGCEALPLQVLINPQILKTGGDSVCWERCLSIPNLNFKVARPAWVKFTAQDLTGYRQVYVWHGLRARVFFHEHDHLRGLTLQRMMKKCDNVNDALFAEISKNLALDKLQVDAGSVVEAPHLGDIADY